MQKNYLDFGEDYKKILDILTGNLNNRFGYGYGSDYFIEKSPKNERDMVLFSRLRDFYQKSPSNFISSYFPAEKASIEFSIREKTNSEGKDFVLDAFIKYEDKKINIEDSKVYLIGKSVVWANICYKQNPRKNILVELDCCNPEIIKYLKDKTFEMPNQLMYKFIEDKYLKLAEIGNVKLPEGQEPKEVIDIAPKPRLFLRDHTNSLSIELRFLYGDKEVSSERRYDIIIREKDTFLKVKRNKNEEDRLVSKLLERTLKEGDLFICSCDPLKWLSETVPDLISQGFEIFGQDKLINFKVSYDKPRLELKISSGIDWFDIKGEVNFGEKKARFEDVINALEKQDSFVKLSDGNIGVIPKKWMSKLAGVVGFLKKEKNGSLKASNTQIQIIESLLDIAESSKVDEKYKEIKRKFKEFDGIKEVPLPVGLQGELREYQKAGYYWLHFLKEFSFGGCLADEMGLGKTVQVLALLLYEKERGKLENTIVIVPTSLIFNWAQEIKKFAPSLAYYIHHGYERLRKLEEIKKQHSDIIITTYGTLRNDLEIFKDLYFQFIILDESQKIKNPLSKSAHSVYNLQGKNRLVLTGTPIENNHLELWSQFAFLNPGLLGGISYFRDYFMKIIDKEKQEEKNNSLRNIINPFLLIRKKSTVAKELPEKLGNYPASNSSFVIVFFFPIFDSCFNL